MASLNQCQFIGNIGRIDTRYLSNGDAVTSFSLAVNETWKDHEGNKKEKCEWINVVAYKKLAEIIAEYCSKGMQVYVSGRMSTRKWTDKSNIERYTTEIVADRMQMLGGKPSGGDGVNNNSARHTSKTPHQDNDGGGFEDMEDDIPF